MFGFKDQVLTAKNTSAAQRQADQQRLDDINQRQGAYLTDLSYRRVGLGRYEVSYKGNQVGYMTWFSNMFGQLGWDFKGKSLNQEWDIIMSGTDFYEVLQSVKTRLEIDL